MYLFKNGIRIMKTKIIVVGFLFFIIAGIYAGEVLRVVEPYESKRALTASDRIDRIITKGLEQRNIIPANKCSDQVFLRRAFVDVIGTLPTSKEANRFYRDPNPDKRSALINHLLNRDEFADYWSLKWGDILRVKAEFPINLWPNGVQAYHRWIRESIRTNKPYDRFARELLTSSGSNFRTPPVNFYRAIQDHEPSSIARAVALSFMGSRIDKWQEDRQCGMAAFFSRIAYKNTAEWKEEIVYPDPAPAQAFKTVFPDGSEVWIKDDEDPRMVFAEWLISGKNPWFARNAVNRIWSWLMGRGIVHEPDDIRPDNPPAHPELLSFLEKELVESGYNLKHIYRIILISQTYQLSSIPQSNHPEAEALFAFYPVRRLDAEVLIDALDGITGARENYYSEIPEPFTYIPQTKRTIALADGSITSDFLEKFGRPTRDTGLESERNNQPTDTQRLYLLNSAEILKQIDTSWQLRALFKKGAGKNNSMIINRIYLGVLSRFPTKEEMIVAEKYFSTKGLKPVDAAKDLTWALINTKEFLYRH